MGDKKKSYLGYAPKQSNVVKLATYIQTNPSVPSRQTKETKLNKGKQKRF